MPTLETLTKDHIKPLFKPNSLKRAYQFTQRLRHLSRQGNRLNGQIATPRGYQVEIEVEADSVYARCTCPYDWGGYCKHIGAVLLVWLDTPSRFTQSETGSDDYAEITEFLPAEEPLETYRPEQLPAWLMISFADRCKAEKELVMEQAETLRLQDLRYMAKLHGWKARGTSKAKILESLQPHLTDAMAVAQGYAQLDEAHLAIFKSLALLGSNAGIEETDIQGLAAHWQKQKKGQPLGRYLELLDQYGFIIYPREPFPYPFEDSLGSIRLSVLHHLPPILEDDIAPITEPPENKVHLADAYALPQQIMQLLLLLEQQPADLRPPLPRPYLETYFDELIGWDYVPEELANFKPQGQWYEDTINVLTVPPPAYHLSDEAIDRLQPFFTDADQLDFIYSLAVSGGLIQPGTPATIWPEVKDQFVRLTPEAQWATLVRLFVYDPSWSTAWHMIRNTPDLQLKRETHIYNFTQEGLLSYLLRFRMVVLRVLSCLPHNTWIKVADVELFLKKVWPNFDGLAWQPRHYRTYQRSQGWYLTHKGKELKTSSRKKDWQLAQGAFLQHFIKGPLHWLGLADFRLDGDKVTAFRLHNLAELLRDQVENPTPSSTPKAQTADTPTKLTVNNLEIIAPPSALSPQAHSFLNRIARLEEVITGQFRYCLDVATVHQTFEAGFSLTQLETDWQETLSQPMPTQIQQALSDWWQGYGQIRLYEDVTIIEFSDAFALREMKAVTSLEDFIIAEISPQAVLIPEEAVTSLSQQLEKAGYTPKQTDSAE
ncbi:MAG: helicase-associated domain-containing protein [Chloroflexota bacterium]